MTSKESSTVLSPFDLLPDEIWLRIFLELPVATICLCRVVSKKWYHLSLDETLWQYYSSLLYEPGPLPPRTSSTLHSWESFYRLQRNWQRGTTTKVFSFQAHNNNKVTALKLRGNILVTGSNDNCLVVWNIKTGKKERAIDVGADIICVDFITHKDVIACGSYYGDFGCQLISLSTGKTLGKFSEDQWIGTQCMDMNDEYIVLGTYRGTVHVLLWEEGRKVTSFNVHANRVAGVRIFGKDIVMSVSSNGAIDIFNITTNKLLHQYILPRTSVNICSFDRNVDGRDVLCIAPKGTIFHLRWEDLPPSSFDEKDGEDERIRRIFSKDPIIIYQNSNIPQNLYCAGIDSKYNHGIIGSQTYPPRGRLLVYPITNSASENIGDGIENFNEITLLPTSDNAVFNVLDIDDERIVAGCTRGWIYCFGFNVDQELEEEDEEKKEKKEINLNTNLSNDHLSAPININGHQQRSLDNHSAEQVQNCNEGMENLVEELYSNDENCF